MKIKFFVTVLQGKMRCRTSSSRAQFYEKMLETCDMIDDPDCPKAGKHREYKSAQIKKSEKAVQHTMTAIRSFTNPFTMAIKDNSTVFHLDLLVQKKSRNRFFMRKQLGRNLRGPSSRRGSRISLIRTSLTPSQELSY